MQIEALLPPWVPGCKNLQQYHWHLIKSRLNSVLFFHSIFAPGIQMLPHKWQCQKLHQFSVSVPGKIRTSTRTDLGVKENSETTACGESNTFSCSSATEEDDKTSRVLVSPQQKWVPDFHPRPLTCNPSFFPSDKTSDSRLTLCTTKSWSSSGGFFPLGKINFLLHEFWRAEAPKGLRSWDFRLTSKDSLNKQEQKNEQTSEIM